MKNQQVTLIHYGELSLKGKNRSFFENKLVNNIETIVGGKVNKLRGRFVLEGGDPEKLKLVFGISWYAQVIRVAKDLELITDTVLSEVESNINNKNCFGVYVKRADKNFPFGSMELESIIGQKILDKFNIRVDLKNPDLSVFIEISENVFIYFNKTQGLGGLPIDTSGKVLSLLSGGIDSPVSSYLMMKRGCRINFIHFHVFSNNKDVLNTKMKQVIEKLNEYQVNTVIYLVPYYLFEMALLRASSLNGYEMVLFRRFMLLMAERIALKNGYKALVTGDSLGQVASQTIENITQVSNTITLPIFQPLIAYDKQEIINMAKQISTYELSIEKYKDCCSIITKNPKTKADSRKIKKIERNIKMNDLIEQTLEFVSVVGF